MGQFELVWQLPWKDLLPETVTANTKEQEEKNDQQEKEKKEKKEQLKSKDTVETMKKEERLHIDATMPDVSIEETQTNQTYGETKEDREEKEQKEQKEEKEDVSMWVSFLHLPRTRYYEEGGNYSDDFRGGGGDGGAVVRRRMGMRPMGKTSDLDGLASTMSFMQRKIRCGSRSTAKKIVKLLKKGVLITRSNEKETGRSSSMKSMKYNNNKKKNRIVVQK